MIRLLPMLAATLLAGCATATQPSPPALSSPASPAAPEGRQFTRTTSLRPDEMTRKTNALLSAAQKEQEHWDAYGPVSGTSEDAPATDVKMEKMEMKHDHH